MSPQVRAKPRTDARYGPLIKALPGFASGRWVERVLWIMETESGHLLPVLASSHADAVGQCRAITGIEDDDARCHRAGPTVALPARASRAIGKFG